MKSCCYLKAPHKVLFFTGGLTSPSALPLNRAIEYCTPLHTVIAVGDGRLSLSENKAMRCWNSPDIFPAIPRNSNM